MAARRRPSFHSVFWTLALGVAIVHGCVALGFALVRYSVVMRVELPVELPPGHDLVELDVPGCEERAPFGLYCESFTRIGLTYLRVSATGGRDRIWSEIEADLLRQGFTFSGGSFYKESDRHSLTVRVILANQGYTLEVCCWPFRGFES